MNKSTFNFEKDHPELYAQVQENKKNERRISTITFILTILVNLSMLKLLMDADMNVVSFIIIMINLSFANSFTIAMLVRKYWK